ncbi:MAG: hypothetical protein U1F43_15310 [Myxococcota bacterium]
MSNWSFAARIPRAQSASPARRIWTSTLPVLAGLSLFTTSALASAPDPKAPAPLAPVTAKADDPAATPVAADPGTTSPATDVPSNTTTTIDSGPAATTTTTVTTGTEPSTMTAKKFGGSASWETAVGLGTFVSGAQQNSLVVSTLSGSGYYQLADNLKLTAGLSLTWYQVLDVDTTLADNTVLLSDIQLGIAHGRIFHDDSSGFNVGGSIRIGLPTSLASQFQNRLFSLSTGLNASIPVGPVTFSYAFTFGKYFNRTAVPTLDCTDFANENECIEGRGANPNFGFESERRGPEVYLRGSGATSYYFSNSLDISWSIIEGLDLSLGIAISNAFGVRSFPQDEFSNEHAAEGRAQSNRLTSSLSLSYQFIKQLSAALSFVTDTSQPFGADGNSGFPVVFDLERAPDNISSLALSVTGSF